MKTAIEEDNVDFNSTGTISTNTSLTDIEMEIESNDGKLALLFFKNKWLIFKDDLVQAAAIQGFVISVPKVLTVVLQ